MIRKAQALEVYRRLLLNRTLEERMVSLARVGRIASPAISSGGRQGAVVAAVSALGPQDWLACTIQSPGAFIARGMSATEILAQAMGRMGSPGNGRDGLSGLGSLERRVIAGTAMAGTLMPVIAGVGIAVRLLKSTMVAMAVMDEIQTNSTDFHEGLNLAAVRRAPVIVVILANDPEMRTPTESQTAVKDLLVRAGSYGVDGFDANGLDPLATFEMCGEVIEMLRRDNYGPALVIVRTKKGRQPLATGAAVTPSRTAPAHQDDTVRNTELRLAGMGWLSHGEREALRKNVMEEVDAATTAAGKSPVPDCRQVRMGIYHEYA